MGEPPRIAYSPRPDATPEAELNALVAIYRYIIFESSASKEAARPGGPDDVKESKHNVASRIISENKTPKTPTPPVTDPERWQRLLNLLFWLERDEDFRWARSVRASICGEEDQRARGVRR
jgi:hypothetical protein